MLKNYEHCVMFLYALTFSLQSYTNMTKIDNFISSQMMHHCVLDTGFSCNSLVTCNSFSVWISQTEPIALSFCFLVLTLLNFLYRVSFIDPEYVSSLPASLAELKNQITTDFLEVRLDMISWVWQEIYIKWGACNTTKCHDVKLVLWKRGFICYKYNISTNSLCFLNNLVMYYAFFK